MKANPSGGPSTLPPATLSPEEFRRMFQEAITNDPDMVRQLLRPLVGAVIPIAAGTPADDVILKASGTTFADTQTPIFEKDGNKIGIGTTTPSKRLTIDANEDISSQSPGQTIAGIELANNGGGVGVPGRETTITFSQAEGTSTSRYAAISGIVTGSSGTTQTGAIIFSTKPELADTALTERMRIASNGAVGIGTTNPVAQLQIKPLGPQIFSMDRRGNGDGNGEFWNFAIQNAGASDTLSVGQSSSNYLTGGTLPWIGNSNAFLYFNQSQQFRIGSGTGSTPHLTIAGGSGNVGIGTASPGAKLDVPTGAAGIIGLIVQGAASQTASLQQWKDSGGSVKACIDEGGRLLFNNTDTKQSSGGPELISAQGSDQDNVVLWAGLTSDTEGRFLFSHRGFLEWGAGTTNDQDVALFRNQRPGLSIQNFTSTTSDRAFSVNAPTSSGGSEFPLFVVNTQDRSMRLAPGLISGNLYSGSDYVVTRAEVTTTNATATAIFTLPLTDGRSYFITAKVIGRKSDGNERAFYWRTALVYRQGAGAVVQGGTPAGVVSLATVESSGAISGNWDCTIVNSGNNIEVQVTGQASTTIHWVTTVEYQSVATSS